MIHEELLEINKHETNNPREDSMKDSEHTFRRRHTEIPRDELVIRRIQMQTGKCFSSGTLVTVSKAGGAGTPPPGFLPRESCGQRSLVGRCV